MSPPCSNDRRVARPGKWATALDPGTKHTLPNVIVMHGLGIPRSPQRMRRAVLSLALTGEAFFLFRTLREYGHGHAVRLDEVRDDVPDD
jgi:hypothetical protein